MTRSRTSALLLAVVAAMAPWCAASAQDHLKVAVGARGVGETFVAELGQDAGIFKKHGLSLDVLYTQGGGETQQVVIANSAQIGVAAGFLGTLGAYAKGAPIHRFDLYRWQPAVLVRPGQFTDQESAGHRRQDRGLFDQWFFDPHGGSGVAKIIRRQVQAYPDRRRARDADAGDERPDRCRLGGRAIRS